MATINGTTGNDSLVGTNQADTITGLAGSDTLRGEGGADSLIGGDALFDLNTVDYGTSPAGVVVSLAAGSAQDGFGGTDTLSGFVEVIGSPFADSITGSATSFIERLDGGLGDDTLDGDEGSDTLTGGLGNDRLIGGSGNFSGSPPDGFNIADYSTSPAGVIVDLGAGTAQDGFGGTDTLILVTSAIGSAFADSIVGAAFPNAPISEVMRGGAGNDTLAAGGGYYLFLGDSGSDSLTGGPTLFDGVQYGLDPAAVLVDLNAGTAQDGYGFTDTLSAIEDVFGSAFDDTIIGNGQPNFLDGGSGADSIDGGDGDDFVSNSAGRGTLRGGAGNDRIQISDIVDGGNGNETIIGSEQLEEGSLLEGGPGNDTFSAGDGFETLDYRNSPGCIVDLSSGAAFDGFGGIDRFLADVFDSSSSVDIDVDIDGVLGSAFDDTLAAGDNGAVFDGGGGADSLLGANGDDTLYGGAGDDTLLGLDGDDYYEGGQGNDMLNAFTGIDTASYDGSPAGVIVVLGATGVAQDGFGTTDALFGIDRVIGSDFNDSLSGFFEPETLDGGAGADTLSGGGDNDTLLGGAGNDLFSFPSVGAGIDRIADLTAGDVIRIAGAAFPSAANPPSGAQLSPEPEAFVPTPGDGSTVGLNQVQMSTAGGITTLFIGTDGAAGADVVIELTGSFVPNDFVAIGSDIVLVPSVSIADAGRAEANGGAANLQFTVSLSVPAIQDVTVTATTANGTASAGSDYMATAGTVTIPAGQTSATFSVPVSGDMVVEPDETLTVTLSNPVGATLGDASATGTIANDDATLTIAAASVTEGNGGASNLIFTITRTGATAQAVTVAATTADGTASAGGDYTAAIGTVTIPAGQASATFTVVVQGDTVQETDETLTVTLSNPVGATLGGQSSATGTILNDDTAAPILSIANTSIGEGNAGSGNLVFTVSLSQVAAQDVTVQAGTQDEIARGGSDYTATTTTVTIPAGQTSATFSVPISGDAAIEIDESFAVALTNPTGGAVISTTAGAARGFILNDDVTPSIAINGQTLNGTGGDDFLVASALNDSVRGEGGADTEFGNEQNDILLGGAGNDFILGDFPGDFLSGVGDFIDAGDGNDNVFAGGGDDTVFGGPGDDLIGGDFGANLILGGDGNNALIGFGDADTIQGGNDGDIVFALSGPDVISTKGGFDLIIAGGDGDGPTDADFIDVADGGSQIFAGSGDDTIIAGEGPDFMLGESGADRMSAGGGVDIVIAGPGNDTLDGGAGNDVIIPEGGDDSIAGGAGADLFRYPAGIAVDADRIIDFAPADDTVELGAALGFAAGAAALAAVTQNGADAVLTLSGGSITFVGVQATALTAGDFVIV